MRKVFTICALLICFSAFTQEKNNALMISSGNIGFSTSSYRYVDSASLGTATTWTVNPGLMYGWWKGKNFIYLGAAFTLAGNKVTLRNRVSTIGIAPTVGIMKKVAIGGGPLYYMPSIEGFVGYMESKCKDGDGRLTDKHTGYHAGVNFFPLSMGVQATPKLNIVLTLGNISVNYTSMTGKSFISSPSPAFRTNTFTVDAVLNTVGVRLLLKI